MFKNTMEFRNYGSYAELLLFVELIDKNGEKELLTTEQIIQDDDIENVLDTVKYYESQGIIIEYIEPIAYKGY